jgi:pimeloyl-ACP methyl ester carboxylesterase
MADIVRFKEGNIHYKVYGKGFPVILLHGYLENMNIWEKIIPLLKKKFQFIAIDLPGHGKSDFIKLKDIDEMAEAVNGVVAQLQLKKIYLIGHSMGGYVALSYYKKYKSICGNVCLFHSTANADNDLKKIDRERAIIAIKTAFDKYVYLITSNLFSKTTFVFMKNEMIEFIQMALQTKPKAAIEAVKIMKNRPNREHLVKQNPTNFYYLLGEEDQLLPIEKMNIELNSKPGVRYKYLLNTGHLGFLECPEEVAKYLNADFLILQK